MRTRAFFRLALSAVVFSALALPGLRAAEATCPDIASRGYLNVLTLNLLFSEIQYRNARLDAIAASIAGQPPAARPDVILLQEIVSGLLVQTADSSRDLQKKLLVLGLPYNQRSRLVTGLPGLLLAGNAILSRCEIVATISRVLPVVTEEPFPSLKLSVPLARVVMMSRIDLPSAGKLNVYNTHLCAFCDPLSERLKQVDATLDFVKFVQWWLPARIVLGGDFNLDLNDSRNVTAYNLILNAGFVDSYVAVNGAIPCTSSNLAGCTYGNPLNPWVTSSPFPGPPARIDYIFAKGVEATASVVVFNGPLFVSDHMGLFTSLR